MTTAAKEVVDLLNQSKIQVLHQAYPFVYGSNLRAPVEQADILISEVGSSFQEAGSNFYTKKTDTVQVSIFYGQKFGDMNGFEDKIMQYLMKHNWIPLSEFDGHSIDPKSGERTFIFKVTRRKKWN